MGEAGSYDGRRFDAGMYDSTMYIVFLMAWMGSRGRVACRPGGDLEKGLLGYPT